MKTSPKRSYSVIENERIGLVFAKTVSIISGTVNMRPMPEIIDPVFAKTSQNDRFLLSENERFGLVFVKTGSINSGTGCKQTNSVESFSKMICLCLYHPQ